MALSANKNRASRESAPFNAYKATNAVQFYGGSLVGISLATGYAVKWADTANYVFKGIAQTKVLGDTSASPVPEIKVNEGGEILEGVTVTGASAITDTGKPVYATDDDTLTLTATVNVKAVGYVFKWIVSTTCDVKLFTPAEYLSQNWTNNTFVKVAADGAAATATSETPILVSPGRRLIKKIFIQPGAALTANDTDYATLIFSRRDSDAANKVTIASVTTKATGGTGSWVAFDDIDVGALTNTILTVGQKVTFEITKAGSGVVVPISAYNIEYVDVA